MGGAGIVVTDVESDVDVIIMWKESVEEEAGPRY